MENKTFTDYNRYIDQLEKGSCKYTWDELEEIFSEAFEGDELTSGEYDTLMRKLMETEAD